jgi:hypothetical protein
MPPPPELTARSRRLLDAVGMESSRGAPGGNMEPMQPAIPSERIGHVLQLREGF